LAQTLRTLEKIKQAIGLSWRIMVIDNNSDDETPSVCREFQSALPLNYLFEPIQGLSTARNRAIKECGDEYLLFLDDDMNVAPDWLRGYAGAFERFPKAEYFGGRITTEWKGSKPDWVENENSPLLSGLFGHYDLGAHTRRYEADDPLPFGGNFAIKKGLSDRIGPFRTDLGVKGNQMRRGEETEYLARAKLAGAAGVYVGEAVCGHRLRSDKLRLIHMFRHGKQKGISDAMCGTNRKDGSYARAVWFLIRGLRQLGVGREQLFRQCVINAGMELGARRYRRTVSTEKCAPMSTVR
jgi:glycosyltransferase involved in cell wall biosynthesis